MTPRQLRRRREKNAREVRHAVLSIRGRCGATPCSMFGHAPEGLVHLSPALHAVIGECANCGEQMSESETP